MAMNRDDYSRYLAHFNARDYEAVLAFFAPRFEIRFAGIVLPGRESLLAFYRFLHAHLRETIALDRFVADAHTVAVEVRVRIEGVVDLSAAALAEAGWPQLLPLAAGQVLEMPQFIHYHLDATGRIERVVCALA